MPIRIDCHRCAPVDMVRSGRVLSTIAAGLPACMNDILNGGGAEDFLHWAVPEEEHAVLDAVEESAGLPKELLERSRANCAAGREHAVRSSG